MRQTIIGRQFEGSLIRGFDNLLPTLTLTLTLGLSIVKGVGNEPSPLDACGVSIIGTFGASSRPQILTVDTPMRDRTLSQPACLQSSPAPFCLRLSTHL